MSQLGFAMVALLVCACSSGGGGSSASLEGAYFGNVALEHNVSAQAIFMAGSLVVADDGNAAGSTLTTTSPTSVVGEIGVVTGRFTSTSEFNVEADLAIAFPTLGAFTAKGAMFYAATTRALAGNLTARDAQRAVIGSLVMSVQRE
jgi:hypothetical protein